MRGGPILCQANPDNTPNPNQCYRPSAENELNISIGPNMAGLIIAPASITTVVGVTSGVISIQNQSLSVTANNLSFNAGGVMLINNTCPASLPAQATCTFQVESAATGSYTVTAQGSNTTLVSLDVTVIPVPQATINVNPSTLNLTQGGPAQLVTLNNTSANDAENLLVTIPGASAITIDAPNTTCTNTLPANSSCQYSFLPGAQEEVGTMISIAGSNTVSPAIITANVNEVVITLTPNTLTFNTGSTGTTTVTNTSTDTAVTNLQVNIPGLSNITVDIGASTCTIGGSLAASGTCTFVFESAVPEVNTVITIEGDNSNSPQLTVTTQIPAPNISITTPSLANRVVNVNNVTPLTLTIANAATDSSVTTVSATLPAGWGGAGGVTLVTDPGCTNLMPGNTCTLELTSTAPIPFIPGQMTINGTNGANTLTTYIAMRMNGGLVFNVTGISPASTVKVVEETDNPLINWGADIQTNANSISNGQSNTSIIAGTPGISPSAAVECSNLNQGGFTDWYLPAICELGRVNTTGPTGDAGCGIITPNIFSTLFSRGFGNFMANRYWSSSESQVPGQEATSAWVERFENPNNGAQVFFTKSSELSFRCTRSFYQLNHPKT